MTHFATAASVTADILEQVWQDMDYRIDVYPYRVSVNYHTNIHSFFIFLNKVHFIALPNSRSKIYVSQSVYSFSEDLVFAEK
jgi:hypothetical protein